MKNIITLIVLTLFSLKLTAQQINHSIAKSDLFKDEYKNSNIVLVEDDGKGGVFVVRSFGGMYSSGFGYYFERYDSNLKLIKEFEYEIKRTDMILQGSVIGIIVNNNEVTLIDFVYDGSAGAYLCKALTSNIDEFNFKSRELFRIDIEKIKHFSFFSGGDFDSDSGAKMILNENKDAFAITVDIKDRQTETHRVFLFDAELNKKIDHTFKKNIADRKFKYENIDVSKDGNTLYILGKVYSKEKKSKKEGGKYQFELTKITKDGEQTQVFDTEEHYSRSLKTIIFEDRLTCVGLYSDRKDSRFKGICYFELDPTSLEIKKSKFNPFTEQFMIDKYGKDKDKELKNLSFRGLMVTKNNDIVFNAEEFYITTHTHTTPNGGFYSVTYYNYDDIVSAKINNSGDLVWARNINKRQATTGDTSYFSYTSTVIGDDTYFFINAGEKVKKLSNDRILFGNTSAKRANLNIIKVSPNGDFEFQEILDDKENEVPFKVSNGAITSNSVIFMGQKGRKKQLLKITL